MELQREALRRHVVSLQEQSQSSHNHQERGSPQGRQKLRKSLPNNVHPLLQERQLSQKVAVCEEQLRLSKQQQQQHMGAKQGERLPLYLRRYQSSQHQVQQQHWQFQQVAHKLGLKTVQLLPSHRRASCQRRRFYLTQRQLHQSRLASPGSPLRRQQQDDEGGGRHEQHELLRCSYPKQPSYLENSVAANRQPVGSQKHLRHSLRSQQHHLKATPRSRSKSLRTHHRAISQHRGGGKTALRRVKWKPLLVEDPLRTDGRQREDVEGNLHHDKKEAAEEQEFGRQTHTVEEQKTYAKSRRHSEHQQLQQQPGVRQEEEEHYFEDKGAGGTSGCSESQLLAGEKTIQQRSKPLTRRAADRRAWPQQHVSELQKVILREKARQWCETTSNPLLQKQQQQQKEHLAPLSSQGSALSQSGGCGGLKKQQQQQSRLESHEQGQHGLGRRFHQQTVERRRLRVPARLRLLLCRQQSAERHVQRWCILKHWKQQIHDEESEEVHNPPPSELGCKTEQHHQDPLDQHFLPQPQHQNQKQLHRQYAEEQPTMKGRSRLRRWLHPGKLPMVVCCSVLLLCILLTQTTNFSCNAAAVTPDVTGGPQRPAFYWKNASIAGVEHGRNYARLAESDKAAAEAAEARALQARYLKVELSSPMSRTRKRGDTLNERDADENVPVPFSTMKSQTTSGANTTSPPRFIVAWPAQHHAMDAAAVAVGSSGSVRLLDGYNARLAARTSTHRPYNSALPPEAPTENSTEKRARSTSSSNGIKRMQALYSAERRSTSKRVSEEHGRSYNASNESRTAGTAGEDPNKGYDRGSCVIPSTDATETSSNTIEETVVDNKRVSRSHDPLVRDARPLGASTLVQKPSATGTAAELPIATSRYEGARNTGNSAAHSEIPLMWEAGGSATPTTTVELAMTAAASTRQTPAAGRHEQSTSATTDAGKAAPLRVETVAARSTFHAAVTHAVKTEEASPGAHATTPQSRVKEQGSVVGSLSKGENAGGDYMDTVEAAAEGAQDIVTHQAAAAQRDPTEAPALRAAQGQHAAMQTTLIALREGVRDAGEASAEVHVAAKRVSGANAGGARAADTDVMGVVIQALPIQANPEAVVGSRKSTESSAALPYIKVEGAVEMGGKVVEGASNSSIAKRKAAGVASEAVMSRDGKPSDENNKQEETEKYQSQTEATLKEDERRRTQVEEATEALAKKEDRVEERVETRVTGQTTGVSTAGASAAEAGKVGNGTVESEGGSLPASEALAMFTEAAAETLAPPGAHAPVVAAAAAAERGAEEGEGYIQTTRRRRSRGTAQDAERSPRVTEAAAGGAAEPHRGRRSLYRHEERLFQEKLSPGRRRRHSEFLVATNKRKKSSANVPSLSAFRDRLSTVRDYQNDLLGAAVMNTVAEEAAAKVSLTAELATSEVAQVYTVKFAQATVAVEACTQQYESIKAAVVDLQKQKQVWELRVRSYLSHLAATAEHREQVLLQAYLEKAQSLLQMKLEELSLAKSVPRVDAHYFSILLEHVAASFSTSHMAFADLSTLLNTPEAHATVDELAVLLLANLQTISKHWKVMPILFSNVSSATAIVPQDYSVLHTLPGPETVRTALKLLRRKEHNRNKFVLVAVNQLNVSCTLFTVQHRTVRQASEAMVLDQQLDVPIPAAGRQQQGVAQALAGAGKRAMQFLTFSAPETAEMRTAVAQVRQEVTFLLALELACSTHFVFPAPATQPAQAVLGLSEPSMGGLKSTFVEEDLVVLVGFTDETQPSAPLSALFRSSVAIIRIELARSAYGRREFAVPTGKMMLHGLSLLSVYPGDMLLLVTTDVTRDTRFSYFRRKISKVTTSLCTGGGRETALSVKTAVIPDIRGRYLTHDMVLHGIIEILSAWYLPQHLAALPQLHHRVLYVQLIDKGGNK